MHEFLKICRKQNVDLKTKVMVIQAFRLIISLKFFISLLNYVRNEKSAATIFYNNTSFNNCPCFTFIEIFIFYIASSYCLVLL